MILNKHYDLFQVVQGGSLETILTEIQEKSEQAFIIALQQHVSSMLVRVETPPRDLSPTPAINQLLAVLRDMLSTASMNEGREVDMGKVNLFCVYISELRVFILDCELHNGAIITSGKRAGFSTCTNRYGSLHVKLHVCHVHLFINVRIYGRTLGETGSTVRCPIGHPNF